ncbi:MAG TPA: MATE family efflux transporter [Candidatus Egerieimonas intestinavium]|uniref:MATE family efflux transporter n=1 Tax=Candidatus Egerieimonas intestinavium TaxID=2840777 RepID=A0A9D1JFT6_9FIRM|nr:MATE family efflux transporter [Candidatus Egerieimonas intestinavium]
MNVSVFEKDSIPKTYLKLSFPVVLGSLVSIIYNITDTFFIAQTQNTELVTGVSLCTPVFTLLMALGNIFGQGGNSVISRLLGQKNLSAAKKASSFCFYAALFSGFLLGFFLLSFRTPALKFLGADSTVFSYASDYYSVMALGAPLAVFSFVPMNLLRSEGMAVCSMAGTIGGSVINMLLDPIFIFHFRWGSAGAAAATVIGYLFSDLFYAAVILKKSRLLSLNLQNARISFPLIREITGIGASAALSNVTQSVAQVLTNQFLLPYGNLSIAAMGIAQKINLIVLLVITGFSFGGLPLIGYFFGGKQSQKLKRLIGFSFSFLLSVTAILSLLVFLGAPFLLSCFMADPSIIQAGTLMLRLQVFSMVFVAIALYITVFFQAVGRVKSTLLLSGSRQGFVFLLVLPLSAWLLGYLGVLWAQSISNMLTALAAIILFYRYRRGDQSL